MIRESVSEKNFCRTFSTVFVKPMRRASANSAVSVSAWQSFATSRKCTAEMFRSKARAKIKARRLPSVCPSFRCAEDDETIELNESNGFYESDAKLNLDGLLILVVDDEQDTRQLLQQSLTYFGATVITAKSAEEGLQELRIKRPTFSFPTSECRTKTAIRSSKKCAR